MGATILALAGIAVLLGIILIFILVKKKWQAYLLSNAIILACFGILAMLVVQDVSKMQQGVAEKPNLFVLMHEDKMIGAFRLPDPDLGSGSLDKGELLFLEQSIRSDDFSEISRNYFKIMVIDSRSLEGVGASLNDDIIIRESDAFSVLESETPIDTFVDLHLRGQFGDDYDRRLAQDTQLELLGQYPNQNEFKMQVFRIMLAERMKQQGNAFLLEQYKKGNVQFYPETITFSLIKLIPASVFRSALDAIVGSE